MPYRAPKMTCYTRTFAVLVLIAALPATADDALARIRERDRIIVSVKNQGAREQAGHRDPAHFPKRRFEIELAHAMAGHVLGDADKIELRSMRKPDRLPAVASGAVDLGIAMHRISPAAALTVDFSQPYFESGLALLQRSDGQITTWTDLADRRLGRIRHNDRDGLEALSATDFPPGRAPQIIDFESFEDAAAAIVAGNIDGLLNLAVNLDAYLAAHPGALKRSPVLTTEQYAVAVAKGNPALLALINETITALRDSGELQRLSEHAGLSH